MRSFAIVCLGYQLLLFAALSTQAGEKKLPEQVKAVLDNASEFELYWLDPSAKANQSDASLYRWKVLGKTLIKDAMPRSHLVEAIESDIERGKEYAECFEPRHAIRASYEGKTVDLVICYRCRWMYVYVDEKRVADIVIATKSTSLFDKHYRDAEIFLQNNTSVLALSHFIGTWDTQTTLHLPRSHLAVREKGSAPLERLAANGPSVSDSYRQRGRIACEKSCSSTGPTIGPGKRIECGCSVLAE